MSRPLRFRPEIGRHVYGQLRAARTLPPGPALEVKRDPWLQRIVQWLAGLIVGQR